MYIGMKMTIVFYPRWFVYPWWFVTPFLIVVARGELSQSTVHVNLINYKQFVWISFPISYSVLHITDPALPVQHLCIYWTRSQISEQWLYFYCMLYLGLSVLLNTPFFLSKVDELVRGIAPLVYFASPSCFHVYVCTTIWILLLFSQNAFFPCYLSWLFI